MLICKIQEINNAVIVLFEIHTKIQIEFYINNIKLNKIVVSLLPDNFYMFHLYSFWI